ncbi:MAG: UvrD-helicase domain-containing protein [Syntrophotaleaceae bacterium]
MEYAQASSLNGMLFDGLNPQQQAAVRQTDGPLLLLAGAGSGKTRVITSRIAYLVREMGAAPGQILAVTFTNKAAREMKQRAEAMAGRKNSQGMTVCTFHALCVRILKEDIERLGYKGNFSIYGAADQIRLIRDLVQSNSSSGQKLDADRILWLISDAKNRLVPPEDFSPRFPDDHGRAAADIYPRYQKALKAFNAVDFDDLIMLTVRLFRDHPDILAKYQQRFRYIMVDEYQDTNAAQYLLLRQLAAVHGNLCVVGDDDQSIYGWRGADLGNILGFEKDFPATQVIKLEQNYRSTGNILGAANAVIHRNRNRKAKQLWTADGPGAILDYIQCQDGEDEARMVVERIHGECFRGDCRYGDFAVLFRTNAQSRAFEEQLRYENIPYVLIGGQQFFDRKEVKDLLAYFKVLQNPLDEVNLLRILNFPRRGIGSTSADRLIRRSVEQECSLWAVLHGIADLEELGEKVGEAVLSFVHLLEKYRRRFRQGHRLVDTARELIDELGLEDELFRTAEDPAKARRRMDNMAEVLNAMASYQEREQNPTLAGFLEKVSLLDRDEPNRNDKESKLKRDAVVLMSLHSSKGLEFPHVFLVGMEEDLLPHKKSVGEGFDIEEERRLCYVGITRARRTLTLLGASRRKKFGKMQPRIPSRFLEEIPAELVNRITSDTPVERSEAEQEQRAADFFAGIREILGE